MLINRFLTTLAIAAALAGPALADGGYSYGSGSGFFQQTTPRACVGVTAPNGCAFVAALTYDGNGRPTAVTSTGSDLTSSHYNGTLREGAGTIAVTYPDAINGTLTLNGSPSSITRHVIETGRPGGRFNTISTGFYSVGGGSAGAVYWFEVQDDTMFMARIKDGSWSVASGALVLDLDHATSSFSGSLLTCTAGPVCAPAETITVQFPRNNQAVVTRGDGSVELLQPVVF